MDEINNVLGKIATIISCKLEYNELNNKETDIPGLTNDAIKVYPFFCYRSRKYIGTKNRNMKNNYHSLFKLSSRIAAVVFKGDEMYEQNKLLAFLSSGNKWWLPFTLCLQ